MNNGFLYKTEVARRLNITRETLRLYLNERYFDELKSLGYIKNQKMLTPKQLEYLHDKIGLELTDT